MVGDVISVLDVLDIDSAHFFGYSMGGRIGLASGIFASERFRSLVIGGTGCLERDSKILSERYINLRNLYQMGMTTNLDLLDKMKHLTPRMREEWMKNDLDALSAYVSVKEQYRKLSQFLQFTYKQWQKCPNIADYTDSLTGSSIT